MCSVLRRIQETGKRVILFSRELLISSHETFQVLTAASMKTAAFWVVAPCSLVEVYLDAEAASISETSVNLYQTAWRKNTEETLLATFISYPKTILKT
jgi:hypothetical protein